jgi:membrane protein YdbS with pleckstrin-like domain
MNSQLSDYVRQQFQQGKSKDEIKRELLGVDWQETDIDQAFSALGSSQPPRPPAPSTPSSVSSGRQQLDPKAVWLFFLQSAFLFLFILIWLGSTLIFALPPSFAWVFWVIGLAVFLGALVLAFVWAKLTYRFYRYELTEEGFRKEKGVIFKKYVTIPYDRIQNIDIYRGIWARILGLSDINIQTAGMSASFGRFGASGAAAEGRLPALSKEVAEKICSEFIQRARQAKNQGL